MHIESWLDKSGLPILVMKYEDMKYHAFETFKGAVRFLGLNKKDDDIRQAIMQSEFDGLYTQEQEKGFKEKAPDSPAFFRQGIEGGWKKELTPIQVNRVVKNHEKTMERFGYLPLK